jgi:hypothetical protein
MGFPGRQWGCRCSWGRGSHLAVHCQWGSQGAEAESTGGTGKHLVQTCPHSSKHSGLWQHLKHDCTACSSAGTLALSVQQKLKQRHV